MAVRIALLVRSGSRYEIVTPLTRVRWDRFIPTFLRMLECHRLCESLFRSLFGHWFIMGSFHKTGAAAPREWVPTERRPPWVFGGCCRAFWVGRVLLEVGFLCLPGGDGAALRAGRMERLGDPSLPFVSIRPARARGVALSRGFGGTTEWRGDFLGLPRIPQRFGPGGWLGFFGRAVARGGGGGGRCFLDWEGGRVRGGWGFF